MLSCDFVTVSSFSLPANLKVPTDVCKSHENIEKFLKTFFPATTTILIQLLLLNCFHLPVAFYKLSFMQLCLLAC